MLLEAVRLSGRKSVNTLYYIDVDAITAITVTTFNENKINTIKTLSERF